ncbi:hypothetical protein D3C72_2520860 [compost metagenome]
MYVYAPVPPVTETEADPEAAALHNILVCDGVTTIAEGWTIVKFFTIEQPLAAVMVTL